MKYRACCGKRCLLLNCETRENGGCHCLCRLKDHESCLERTLNGEYKRAGPGFIYIPGKQNPPLDEHEKKKFSEELEDVRKEISKYEIKV